MIDEGTTLTYGVLPSREAFDDAFDQQFPEGRFSITNCVRIGSVNLTADQTWKELEKAVDEWEDPANDSEEELTAGWASAVLSVLGFEWV